MNAVACCTATTKRATLPARPAMGSRTGILFVPRNNLFRIAGSSLLLKSPAPLVALSHPISACPLDVLAIPRCSHTSARACYAPLISHRCQLLAAQTKVPETMDKTLEEISADASKDAAERDTATALGLAPVAQPGTLDAL